jgi:hypothetical protein
MTTTEDTVSVGPAVHRQRVAWCVLVGAVVVVGWVLYRHYVVPHALDRIFRWHTLGRSLWVAELVQDLVVCFPYGLVLVLWGRDLARGVGAAAVTAVTALYLATLDWSFERYVFGLHGEGFTRTSLRVFDWLSLLVVALLVPLAWGVARRAGRSWVVGLIVGPVVAAILHELELRSAWWGQHVVFTIHYHWQTQAVVYVAPFVLAALACWAIEAASARRTPEMQSEIGSSA